MVIKKIDNITKEMVKLWEDNMGENWLDYKDATHFVQIDDNGNINAGFAVYYDESDDICGNFISGWSNRKNLDSVEYVILSIAEMLGQVFIKTNKRQVQIIANKLGKLVKKQGEFLYYIVRG